MAQNGQASLVEWLNSNKLNFMKDALVEEDYTLDMIVNMTDEEMIGVFDKLKISNLKRHRFRTAVINLKHQKHSQPHPQAHRQLATKCVSKTAKKNDVNNESKQSDEEKFGSLLSVGDSQRLYCSCRIKINFQTILDDI